MNNNSKVLKTLAEHKKYLVMITDNSTKILWITAMIFFLQEPNIV